MTASKRTRISEDWQPDEAGRTFAAARGVPDSEVGAFVDHHFAHGNLMASWPAAWRTWCRNAVRFGTATGRPADPPMVLAFDQADEFGARAWASQCLRSPDVTPSPDGPCYLGIPLVPWAIDVCNAAGMVPSSRPDLQPLLGWLDLKPMDGVWPDEIIALIGSHRRPDKPTLRYYDNAVRDRARRAA